MKKLLIVITLCIVAFSFTNAFAFSATGWTTVSIVHPWGNGLHIQVANGVNDPESCGGGNGGFMYLPPSNPEYKLISSTLLMAFAAGKSVTIYASGCFNNGSVIAGAMVQ